MPTKSTRRALCLAAGLALVTSACSWPMIRFGPEHTGFNPNETRIGTANVAGLHEIWTAVTSDHIESSPAVDGGFVYVGSDDNHLYAYSSSGAANCAGAPKVCAPLWRANLGGNVQSSPAVDGSRVFVGSVGNRLSAFDKTGVTGCSGSPKVCNPEWSFFFNSDEYSSPTVVNGHVYMEENSDAERLSSVDENTGKAAWISTDVETSNASTLRSSPAVAGGVVYALFPFFVFDPGPGVYAYSANGCGAAAVRCNPLWVDSAWVTDGTSAAVANGVVYVAGAFGTTDGLLAYDAAGKAGCSGVPKLCVPIWTGAGGAASSPAVANGTAFISSGTRLQAFDAAGTRNCSGAPKRCLPLWTGPAFGSNGISEPVVANGIVYIGSTTGVHAYNARTGAALWSSPAGDFSGSSPAVVNGTLYIGGMDNKLHVYALPQRERVTHDELSYCRICAAACGIVVTVDGDQVVRVRGDDAHPVSRGYVCSKGRGLAAWHHSPRRLDRPRLRGREVPWDELLTDLGGRLDAIIGARGPDAVALYLATGLAYDAAGQIAAAQWLPSIGSRSFLTAVTVDNAPVLVAAELVSGQPMLNPVWDPTAPGLAIFVGTNPVVSHGYGTALPDPIRYLREYRARGGRVWVLDPRRSETATHADVHVPVLPGSDVAVLAALANALLDNGADERELTDHCDADEVTALRAALAGFTIERAAATADVDRTLLDQLVADVRTHRGRVAVHCGTGVTMSRDGILAEWLRWVVLIASGSLDRAGGMHFHRGVVNRLRRRKSARDGPDPSAATSRPELPRVVGQIPAVALVDEIEHGNIRALFVTGGNPLTAIPQPTRLEAALRTLDVLAVVDVADNPLCAIATHVLPATGQLERADITLAELTALRSGLQATGPIVDPVAERRPVWWMFAALDRAMGRPALGGADPDDLTDEDYLRGVLSHSQLSADDVFAAGPRGIATPVEHGWVCDELLGDGRWSIAPAALLERLAAYDDPVRARFVLAPRREMPWSNSVLFGAAGPGPVVHMNGAGLPANGVVTLATNHGVVTAEFAADPSVRDGVVSMTHGHPGTNPGNLTSGNDSVDPLTAMPLVSGLEVRVRRAHSL